ncbi:MAG: hypothetical protein ACNA8S_01370 [Deferrisomatales bacterium]
MYDPAEFFLAGPDDFLRLDGRCADLLRDFFEWLQGEEGGGLRAEEASALAHAADRYLRDFVVDILETGPADADPTLPRRYLGNWYIIHTLAPTHEEMERIRGALTRVYRFLPERGLLAQAAAAAAARNLADPEYFRARLEEFWDLTPDTVPTWRAVDDYRRRSAG